MKQRYAVVFEQTPNNYCAYAPDLSGCVSTGETWEEMQEMVREAIAFHVEAMLENGEPMPEPQMSVEDARAYHNEVIAEYDEETLAKFGGDDPRQPTRFGHGRGRDQNTASCQGRLTQVVR